MSSGKSNTTGNKSIMQQNTSNCDSSSGISSSSATSLQRSSNIFGGTVNGDAPSSDSQHYHQLWQDEVPSNNLKGVHNEDNETSNSYGNSTTKSYNGKTKSDHLSDGNQPSTNSQNVHNYNFISTGSNTSGTIHKLFIGTKFLFY